MHPADSARAKGAAIGLVTVLPRIATAALEAIEILGERDLEVDNHTPIGDPVTRSRGSLGSTRTTPSLSDDVGLGPCTGRSKSVSDGVVHTAVRTTVIARKAIVIGRPTRVHRG